MRDIREIVVHCAATRPSMDIGAKTIRKWHKAKGWRDIGYHWVIRRSGTLEAGRDESIAGAHVRGHNRYSIGLCLVGGLNENTFKPENNYTVEQFGTLIKKIRELKKKYPNAKVLGHRDFKGVRKACPCFDVIPWWDDLNQGD